MPFVIMLDEDDNGYKAGRFLRASDLGTAASVPGLGANQLSANLTFSA
jgi:nitrate reductase alpha subunit